MKHADASNGFDDSFVYLLQRLYDKYLPLAKGTISDIALRTDDAHPSSFAISAVSVDGAACSAGDLRTKFSMQSISKPFVYGLALEDHGEQYVRGKTGVEPTGDPFDSMIRHEQVCEGRFNPMVNVGAVTTTSLIKGDRLEDRIDRLKEMFALYMGHPVEFGEKALGSRRQADNMNRALTYLMVSEGCIEANVEETVELYAHQCSVQVDSRDLALMAAVLANGGVNPVTGQRVIASCYVKNLLSVMFVSGLYEFSGQWAYRVGIPAKSGLAGAILAVVPGKMGLAVYSPPLGAHQKSVRGLRVLEEISRKKGHHVFSPCAGRARMAEGAEKAKLEKSEFGSLLNELIQKYKELDWGEIYVSEPDLYHVDRRQFGICAATCDGEVFEAGDCRDEFFIQSISKLFTYGLALEDHGREGVLKKVDVEPTGDAYNAVIKVRTYSKRPHNPMVNAGGIAAASLVKGESPARKLNRIMDMYQRYAGRRVYIDTPAFISEQSANDRNWAISYLLRNFGMIQGDIQPTLDLYLQQCSAIVNCRDVAIMAATLANEGVNPVTGERALKAEYIQDLLTVMYTCGMYDFAGEWAYTIGLPAKSGVAGCILGVVPGRMGIAVFSRPLDHRGNSVRGIKVFEELSRRLQLHIFQTHGS